MKFRSVVVAVALFGAACGNISTDEHSSVKHQAVASPNDPFEPNDSCAEATFLSLPAFPSAELTTGDVDYYTLNLHAGQSLLAGLTAPGLVGVVDPNTLNILAEGFGFVSTTIPANGLYCVAVACPDDIDLNGSGACETEYQLFLQAQTLGPDQFEPNDSAQAAVPVSLPATLTNLSIFPSGDVDWFEVNVPTAGQLLRVTAQPGGIFVPVNVSIYDASGSLLANDSFSASVVVPSAGTYRVSANGFGTGTYDLMIASPTIGPDVFEPNDTVADATPVPGSGTISGLTLDPAGDVDVFRVNVPPSSFVHLSAFGDPSLPNRFHVRVADADGNVIADATNVVDISPPAGDIFVTIHAETPGQVTEYALDVSIITIASDAYEPNNTPAQATPIAPNATIDATITEGDFDLYRVDLGAGSEIKVSLTSTFSPFLSFFVTEDPMKPTSQKGTFFALHSGTYYIAVVSPPGVLDRYRLSLKFTPGPSVLEPGHSFELLPGGPFGAIATDRETGSVYAVNRDDLIARFGADGKGQSWRPSELNPFIHPGYSELAVKRGFGGADVFMVDSAQQIVSSNALSFPGTVFATPPSSVGGLAFSDRALFLSLYPYGPPKDPPPPNLTAVTAESGPSIQMLDKTGLLSPFMSTELSSQPVALAFSHDRKTLYYSNAAGQIVWIDVATKTEGKVVFAGTIFDDVFYEELAPKIAVDGATGTLYALVGSTGAFSIVRYQASTNSFVPFMTGFTDAADLAFGPCAAPDGEACLYVSSSRAVFKVHGFQRPFDIGDTVGDAPPALDIVGVTLSYADLESAGSSTHLVGTVTLAAPPTGSYSLSIDFGESTTLSADAVASVSMASGAPVWSGVQDLGLRSTVSGNQVRFAVPISRLRSLATDPQKLAAAERILVWVSAGSADRAPDTGSVETRSIYPVLTMLPTVFDFEGVPLGYLSIAPLRIANTGIGPLALTADVTGTSYGFAADFGYGSPPPSTIAEGAVAEVEVACAPKKAGVFDGILRARSQAPVGAKQAKLRCAGYATPTNITFTDPAGDFEQIGPRTVDLLSVNLEATPERLRIRATFDRPVAVADKVIPPPPGATLVQGFFEFDFDSDIRTGDCFGCGYGAGYQLGAERQLGFFSARNGDFIIDRGISGHITSSGNTLIFDLPPDVFEFGCFDFAMAVGSANAPDLFQFDVLGDGAPNTGAYHVTVGCTTAKH